MALNLQLEALTVPEGTEFPPTVQADVDQKAQYLTITGDENFTGVNSGANEPSEDNRDKWWAKSYESGQPIGWYAWSGAEWTPIPSIVSSGPTADRPVNAVTGQLFFDTDINVELIYERSQWRTASGSPGDVKEVKAATIDDAITNNPGWVQDTDSVGQVIIGASDGSTYNYNTSLGGESVFLTETDLPDVAIPLQNGWYPYSGQHQNGVQPAGVYPIVTNQSSTSETQSMNSATQTGVSVIQPSRCYWRLLKQ